MYKGRGGERKGGGRANLTSSSILQYLYVNIILKKKLNPKFPKNKNGVISLQTWTNKIKLKFLIITTSQQKNIASSGRQQWTQFQMFSYHEFSNSKAISFQIIPDSMLYYTLNPGLNIKNRNSKIGRILLDPGPLNMKSHLFWIVCNT